MLKEGKVVNIELGALCPTIAEQLSALGLKQVGKDAKVLEKLSKAITLLRIHECLTDKEVTRARRRLLAYLECAYEK